MTKISEKLVRTRKCVVVVTGKEDIITDGKKVWIVKNGHPMMSRIVGTGCMATSVIGTFAAVEKNLMFAFAAGLVCFEIASQLAVHISKGPGSFKEEMYNSLYHLDKKTLNSIPKIEIQ